MVKEKEKDKSIKIDTKDSGSSEAQISLLSEKINHLTKHFEEHKNDKHSTIGLLKAVNQRKRLLTYLQRKKPESYTKILTKLNLRK